MECTIFYISSLAVTMSQATLTATLQDKKRPVSQAARRDALLGELEEDFERLLPADRPCWELLRDKSGIYPVS